MVSLLQRRREMMQLASGAGEKIIVFKDGVFDSQIGTFASSDPDYYNNSQTVTISIGTEIRFALNFINYNSIRTLASPNTVSARGRTLHLIIRSKATDSRARNCWFYCYVGTSSIQATSVPSNGSGLSAYFPNADGTYFYLPYNNKNEYETELTVPITQDNAHIYVGVLKDFIWFSYVDIVEMWIE